MQPSEGETDESRAVVPVLITRQEAAEYLGYEFRTFERFVQADIAWIRRGRSMKTTRTELDRWVAEELERSRATMRTMREPSMPMPARVIRKASPSRLVEHSPDRQATGGRLSARLAKREAKKRERERAATNEKG